MSEIKVEPWMREAANELWPLHDKSHNAIEEIIAKHAPPRDTDRDLLEALVWAADSGRVRIPVLSCYECDSERENETYPLIHKDGCATKKWISAVAEARRRLEELRR